MAQFTFKVRGADGKIEKGSLHAVGYAEALMKVRKLGGIILDLAEAREKRSPLEGIFKKGLGLKDRIVLTEQLAVMLKAGIPLLQALKSLQEDAMKKSEKHLLSDISADIEAGIPLSYAMEKHPESFSEVYYQMVRSAEKSGNLSEVLLKLTIQQQKEFDLKSKVKGALIYPAIISVLMIAVIIMVITFVIPRLTGLFGDDMTKLPATTRFLMALSSFMQHQWYILVILFIGGIIAFKVALKSETGRWYFDQFKIRIPVLGKFSQKAALSRFCQSFAFLSEAGVPVLEIFNTLKGVMGSSIYEREIIKISRDVENGIPLSLAVRKSKYFPGMVGQLVKVGEQSGDLAGIFKMLGDFYEKDVDTMAKNLSTMLEPIIMVVMGAGVGFILISVLQPIYGMMDNI